MTVLITGVRGTIGGGVLTRLHEAGVPVRAGSAAPDAPVPDGVELTHVDLHEPDGLPAALAGVEQVFLYAAFEAADKVAAHLHEAGVGHVVVLSSASVEFDDERMRGHHLAVERAVRDAGLTATMLRPGAFATNTLQWAHPIRSGRIGLPYADAWVEPIHELDVVDAAVAALTDPTAHAGRDYYLTGGESLTQRRQVEILARAAGREVTIDDLTREQWLSQVSGFMPEAFAVSLLDMWQSATAGPGRTDGTVTDLTGAPPRDFAGWAREHRDAFAST